MKKLLLLVLVFIGLKSFSQYPNGIQTIGNDSNAVVIKGALQARVINYVYTDTTEANAHHVKEYPGAQIFTLTDNLFWLRNAAADAWILQSGGHGSSVGHDTVYVADDLYIDSNLNPGFQTIRRYHSNGLVSGGKVIWSGTGMKFYITPAVYYLNGIQYTTGFDSVTLDDGHATLGRIDAFIVDTIPGVDDLTGTAAADPVTPQEDPISQIVLATIFINPGDTIPTSITVNLIYNENIASPTEWAETPQGLTPNFDNTDNPYIGAKAVYVPTYTNGGKIHWVSPTTQTITPNGAISFFIYNNGIFLGNLHVALYTGGVPVSNFIMLGTAHGFNKLDSNRYQLVSVPLSSFVLTPAGGSAGTFDRVVFATTGTDASGSKGFFMDYIRLMDGVVANPAPKIYVDSVTIVAGSYYYWKNGQKTLIGVVPSGGGGGTTDYEIQTASGSTAFTFTAVPASMDDYIIFVNGSKIRQTTDYTTSGNVVTIPTIVSGDKVEYQRIK